MHLMAGPARRTWPGRVQPSEQARAARRMGFAETVCLVDRVHRVCAPANLLHTATSHSEGMEKPSLREDSVNELFSEARIAGFLARFSHRTGPHLSFRFSAEYYPDLTLIFRFSTEQYPP